MIGFLGYIYRLSFGALFFLCTSPAHGPGRDIVAPMSRHKRCHGESGGRASEVTLPWGFLKPKPSSHTFWVSASKNPSDTSWLFSLFSDIFSLVYCTQWSTTEFFGAYFTLKANDDEHSCLSNSVKPRFWSCAVFWIYVQWSNPVTLKPKPG